MVKTIVKSYHESGQCIYWRRKSKETQEAIEARSAQAAEFHDFEFDGDEARRVRRFLDKNCQIEAEVMPVDSDVTAAYVRGEIGHILNNAPAVISASMEAGMLYPLDYEIEGVYPGSIRDAKFEGLAAKTEEIEEKSLDVLPSVELPQVEPVSFFEEGSKTYQVLQILKPYISDRKVEFIIGGRTIARPVLVDDEGRLLAGIADCHHAKKLDLNVQTYSVEINQEVTDRDRAYILLAEVASFANVKKDDLAIIMTILFDDLSAQTGKGRGDNHEMTPAEEMEERTGISPHKIERAGTKARKIMGQSQKKDFGSIPQNKAEQINQRVTVAAKLIQRILERFDRVETELFVRNRMRSELQQRLSVICSKVKPSRSKM